MQTVTTLSAEVIDLFRSSLFERGRSSDTIKAYSSDLRTLLTDLQCSEIQMEDFETKALNWLQANRRIVSPKTTGRRLTSLRAFVRWAHWSPMLEDYNAPTPPRGNPHPLPEGMEGVRRMIRHAATGQQRALIALCGMCGLRIGEALSLSGESFDLHDMEIEVRGKGDKTRRVPLSDEAWSIMCEAVGQAFCAQRQVIEFKDRFARGLVTNLGIEANLSRRVASHDLRATFATELYERTRDIRLVQEVLGHASVTQTELYIGITKSKMREAVNKL